MASIATGCADAIEQSREKRSAKNFMEKTPAADATSGVIEV
jgi:hypothetical protein